MTAVKICGLTRSEDVALAGELGAAALGFNFAAGSPRRVSPEAARRLSEGAGGRALRVGVFVGEDAGVIREAVEAARLDLVQLHRPLRAEDVERPPAPVIAVVRMGPAGAALPPKEFLSRCHAILFDTQAEDLAGGTGRTFDWGLAAGVRVPVPVLLAGGLGPDNVGDAVRRVRPWAVDVASGVERAPGVKDPEKMRRFFRAVREADRAADAGAGVP
jgi:phosphoribosylanthranilate isomerase